MAPIAERPVVWRLAFSGRLALACYALIDSSEIVHFCLSLGTKIGGAPDLKSRCR
jgi:hypothetical protein